MQRWNLNKNFIYILASAALYALLLLRVGYFFGDGDQAEFLIPLLQFADPTLFASDLYAQSIAQMPWTIRSPIIYLFSKVPVDLFPQVFFGFHLLLYTGILFLSFLIADKFLKGPLSVFVAVAIAFYVLYEKSPGMNDLFNPSLIPESFAIFFGLMAIHSFLKDKSLWGDLFLVIAAVFQPLIGLQLTLLNVLMRLRPRKIPTAVQLASATLSTVIVIMYAAWMSDLYNTYWELPVNDIYQLAFEFRNPHHYLPEEFSMLSMWSFIVLTIISAFYFKERHSGIYIFILITLIGCAVYSVGVHFRIDSITKAQWFKTSIWMRIWGGIAIASLLENFLQLHGKRAALIGNFLYAFIGGYLFLSDGWQTAFNKSDQSFKELSIWASQNTPKDAVFVQPFEHSAFSYYGQRSLYVSFKTINYQLNFFDSWYERLQEIYGISAEEGRGFDQYAVANKNMIQLAKGDTEHFKSKGITHLILPTQLEAKSLKLLHVTEPYYLYELK